MLSLTILVLASLIKPSSQTDDCLSVSSSGALFTKEGFVLNGHTRKTISAVSFTQCCLRCVQTDWCVSVNFKTMTRIGECQLNDYGVTSEVEISENGGKFQVKQDAIFSQLRDAKFGCKNSPCFNGGTCYLNCRTSSTHCTCCDGFKGTRCKDINECSSNPCQNGGTCTDQVNGYTCTCVAGFNGVNCEANINECSSNPCQNGGTCTDQVNGYTCTCVAGYNGLNCQTDIDECASNPCMNGGTCADQVNGYTCTCPLHYKGTYCKKFSRVIGG